MNEEGDLNETWDAADYQNMWLSAQVPQIRTIGGNDFFYSEDLPAFYRPNLSE